MAVTKVAGKHRGAPIQLSSENYAFAMSHYYVWSIAQGHVAIFILFVIFHIINVYSINDANDKK